MTKKWWKPINTAQEGKKLFVLPPEDDEKELKEGNEINVLTPNKLLIKLSILIV